MTIPTEATAPIFGMTPGLSQEHFLSDQSLEEMVKKNKKLKKRCKKLRKELELVRKQNAELIRCSLPRKTQKTDKQNTKKSAREKTSWRI